ncbi:MAG: non-homologous end-joining DNA ligase, partial [Mycobacteriales bacterium]
GDEWSYEFKWDGVRTIAFVDGGRVRLQSRNALDSTKAYPELRQLGLSLGSRRVVLDGEIVAMDEAGRPSFSALQPRMHVTSEAKARRLVDEIPITYLAFDLLYLDTQSTMALPFRERRALLESLALDGPSWQTPPSFTGDGDAVLTASKTQQLEGVIAKRLDSPYLPGRRADWWRKIKNQQRQEVVIGGWTHGEGGRAGQIGALLIGVYDGTKLHYAGHVGTGFNQATLVDLASRLKPLARKTSPFADAVPRAHAAKAEWVDPKLVCDVEFTEWTRDGRLRHPSYKGLRNDKKPREVVREVPQ